MRRKNKYNENSPGFDLNFILKFLKSYIQPTTATHLS